MAQSPVEGRGATVQELLSNKKYKLDYYQREYSWSRKDVVALLHDLERRFIREWRPTHSRRETIGYAPYFLGPIVCYQTPDAAFLVDGQQRLTTLHLIVVYLRRLLEEQDLDQDAKGLDPMIYSTRHGETTFNIDIPERNEVLNAFLRGIPKPPPADASLSVRNLYERARDIEEDFPASLRDEALPFFHDWLLDRVCLVSIDALDREHGWEIFETMNNRGARLSPVDLLKSYLLARAETGRRQLNDLWRRMIADLSRHGVDTPSEFVKAVLIAKFAAFDADSADLVEIDRAFHEWVRKNEIRLELRTAADFRAFVEYFLVPLSRQYSALKDASAMLVPGMEAVFHTARLEVVDPLPPILSALRPDDPDEVFEEKSRRIAGYLDLATTLKIVNNRSLLPHQVRPEVDELTVRLRSAEGLEGLTGLLEAEAATLPDDFSGVDRLSLQPGNWAQVRYVLARLTAFVEVAAGRPDLIAVYLDDAQPWEIEHVWPRAFPRYQAEIMTTEAFEDFRERLGALLLLPSGDRLPDEHATKIDHYREQNLLAASLHPETLDAEPEFARFVADHDLAEVFRPWPDHFGLDAIQIRQRLYRRLCELIWRPELLGLRPENTPPNRATVKRSRRKARYGVEIADLIEAGLIEDGTELYGHRKKHTYTARVTEGGRIRLPSGQTFDSVSRAAAVALNVKACNGWDFWRAGSDATGTLLSDLRREALAQGLME
ncbi:hypothetical protein FHR81_001565 [Actinoalloteichus hoggarensis]|uniref:Uncharacterized protein n=1 Tax=Actinoalloteichus hoggarensis TaxID=1470176 RepID=A0A221W0K2_9PSEU|nr:DUF262 domain-containing protein [Actinoalloteichus hoggarensis]ASO19297.1 hypothetical protein AHOG_08260 [Actinoalloteichus hoggarensis]MBB5920535.1 hypothetical protein [Actinoalloteichus hoggarensis]